MNQNNWTELDIEKMIKHIQNTTGKVVLGIDGFIDQVWKVIETRKGKDDYVLIDKMKKFGELIVNRGEGGMANELIKKRRSSGGFTLNTGRAIGNLGLNPVLLGMYGKESIEPIFNEFMEKCTLISIDDPVISNILEFSDGKIMMPNLKDLLDFNWDQLVTVLGHEKLKEIFANADIVSLGYWSNMPEFDELITNINDNFFAEGYPKRLFFDFANIKKRSVEAIKETFKVLGGLNKNIPITLSLNEHEAALLFSYYGEELTEDIEKTAIIANSIRKTINLNEIIVHNAHYAIATSETEGIAIDIPEYCENPVITTGAGDTFNGGYISSCLCDININQRLVMANATAGFYINNGFPPSKEELIQEIKRKKEKVA